MIVNVDSLFVIRYLLASRKAGLNGKEAPAAFLHRGGESPPQGGAYSAAARCQT